MEYSGGRNMQQMMKQMQKMQKKMAQEQEEKQGKSLSERLRQWHRCSYCNWS